MKAIIYYRKSTDRDDRQANSLEHQLNNCKITANNNSLEIFKEIGESRSAKTEGTRDGFNEMIKICNTGKINYILADEPKRLSRNNIDTSRIIDLMDKKLIKGIVCTSRQYMADNSRDKFLLQLDLALSKMDNEDRGKDTKDKMESCITNTGRFLGKAPFGYKNITIKKGHRDIIIDKKEAKLVKEIFKLRADGKAYSTIAKILKEKYKTKIKFNFSSNRIQRLISKKFYFGVFTWNNKEIIGKHEAIISKELYDIANNIGKGTHEKTQTIKKREPGNYHLKGFVKDTSGLKLTSYMKKGHTYYKQQSISKEKVSINEKILFEKIGVYIKKQECENINLEVLNKKLILDSIKEEKIENKEESKSIDGEIKKLKNKQDKLLDLRLDDKITNDIYLLKNNQIINVIKELEEQKEKLKNDDFQKKALIIVELAKSYYRSYLKANYAGKIYIAKKLMVELLVNTKKELQIKDSPILKSSNLLKNLYGIPSQLNKRTFKENLSKVDLIDLIELQDFIKSL